MLRCSDALALHLLPLLYLSNRSPWMVLLIKRGLTSFLRLPVAPCTSLPHPLAALTSLLPHSAYCRCGPPYLVLGWFDVSGNLVASYAAMFSV